jgi:F-type H+-transporting ATPase subunit alpha
VQLQAAVLWSMQKGYLDPIPVERVKEFQLKLQEFLSTRKEEVLNKILAKKQIDDEIEKDLTAALDEFKILFK